MLTVSGNLDDQKQERFWRAAAAASERLEGRNRTVSFAAVILGKKHSLLRLEYAVRFETNRVVPAKTRRGTLLGRGTFCCENS